MGIDKIMSKLGEVDEKSRITFTRLPVLCES